MREVLPGSNPGGLTGTGVQGPDPPALLLPQNLQKALRNGRVWPQQTGAVIMILINLCVDIIVILITHQSLLRAGQAQALRPWAAASWERVPGAQNVGKVSFPGHTQ